VTVPPDQPSAAIARLLHLFTLRSIDGFRHPFETASDGALAEARALGPALAAEAIAWVLQRHEPGRDHRIAERAADTAGKLRLSPAVPALVSCLERLSEYDPVAHAAVRALEAIGAPAVDPLLAAFARCATVGDRVVRGSALARMPVRDGRVCAALEALLAEDPERGAPLLASHGDRRALPALAAALDRLELPPEGPGELTRLEVIVAVAHAIMSLKGKMTPPQREKFERAYARSDDLILGGCFEERASPG
jgi:hypothetical protein